MVRQILRYLKKKNCAHTHTHILKQSDGHGCHQMKLRTCRGLMRGYLRRQSNKDLPAMKEPDLNLFPH